MRGDLRLLLSWGILCLSSASEEVVCGNNQYLPNPLDCSSYYECSNGTPYLMPCPTGEDFSPTALTCASPDVAGCKITGTVVSTTLAASVPVITASTPNLKPIYYCPGIDGSGSYLYPNPLSCSSFYMCNGGQLELFQCPQGLEYSVTERVCLYPNIAKCDLNNLPTFPYGPTTPASCQATGETVTATTSAVTEPTPNYYCPEVDGSSTYLYPNPYSCSSYYMCAEGKLYLFQCPWGLEYSVNERICIFPYLAKCDLNHLPTYATGPTEATPVTIPTSAVTSGPVPSYYCPEVDGSVNYIYPSPYSCSSYYMCAEGKLYLFQCPSGLEYSVIDRVCAFPYMAKCDLNNLPSYPTGPTEAPTASNPTSAVTPGPVPNYYCPEVDGANTYIYPSPYSCSSYYMCAEGKLYLFQCPSGLEYSVIDRVCAFPYIAKCDLNNLPSYPTGPTEAPTASNPTSAVTTGPIPNYYCPEVDGANTYIYPSPYSCSSYYMCAEGKLYLFQCPSGLEYSVIDRVCAFPYIAKCDLNNLPSYPTGPTEAPTASNPTSAVTTGPIPNYYCPEVDGANTYIYPSPYSCSSYYMCAEGKLYLFHCPSGLEYSVMDRVCAFPYIAKCDLNNLPTYPTGPTEATAAPSPTTAVAPWPIPNYYCPVGNNSYTYLYPNPYSCSSYYMCTEGFLYLFHCPTGLEYSVTYRVCVLPKIAECDLNNLPTYPTAYTTTTTAASANLPTAVTTVPNYYCPEIDTSTSYIYPNPFSCSSYYQCIGGRLHLYQCPDGFEYSVEERTCDFPSVAKCDLSSLPTFPTGPTAIGSVGPTTQAPPTEVITPATTSKTTTPGGIIISSTATNSDGSVTVHYECPPEESGTYYRYPGDCHKFFECNYGVAEVQTCPAGLLFSESKLKCDYPANVPECSTSSSSS